ncbi:peptide ABC transporter permease [Bifidobacteriaceae bacterium NR002]|nr:peptide ABC transporter permease [Bifidobacteriaceae bacterium NR002]
MSSKPARKPSSKPSRKPSSKQSRKPSRNNMSAARRRMYIRRRIAVGTALLLILAIAIFCVISLCKGLVAIGGAIAGHEVNISRKAVPDPRPVGLTPRCSARNIRLELSASSQTVPMGGSVEITERFVYDGNSSCLIDASNINAVLTVNTSDEATNSQDDSQNKDAKNQNDSADTKDASKSNDPLSHAVWRSDKCEDVPLKPLLMAKGDHFEKKITWNTNSNSGKGCVADEDLPKVNRGIYVIQLQHKRIPGLHSDPVLINVK